MAKKTPLYEKHVALNGSIIEYAGWALPGSYTSLEDEHEAVRERAGMFDVSHMGEIWVEGKDAQKYANYLLTSDMTLLEDGKIQYTFMCNEKGGVVDDLLAYKYNDEKYLLVVNGANVEKDFDWIKKHSENFDVEVRNASPETAQIAVQGPKAEEVMQKIVNCDLSEITYYTFKDGVEVAGCPSLVSRTGYTGEDGFEVYTDNDSITKIWDAVLEAGKEVELRPCGLGCRDTLRFEASLPLYGNEFDEEHNPVEAGLKFFVDVKSDADYIGRKPLEESINNQKKTLVGFELIGRGIPRHGYEIQKDGKTIGTVTTGYKSPTLGKPIGNAIIDVDYKGVGKTFDVIIRNKPVEAKIIKKKFLAERGDKHNK